VIFLVRGLLRNFSLLSVVPICRPLYNPLSLRIRIPSICRSLIRDFSNELIVDNIDQQLITQPITEPQTVIDVSGLPSGVYFVKVKDDERVMMGKVVVE